SRSERAALVDEAVHAVDLTPFLDHYPWQLSGGMQQRVAIARALAYQPALLLMDEPFASVDAQVRGDLEDLVLRVHAQFGLTTLFCNPGSTEVPFLVGLPDDIRFVLALHEGSVVGLATGWAIGRREPALVVLHTLAGLGNAVGALATARLNRAPLVVVVGQQDRRHLVFEPFTSGRLAGLAGDYPVWIAEPARPQDVPGAVSRAYHEAQTGRGPALVIVPMDDWAAPAGDADQAAPAR